MITAQEKPLNGPRPDIEASTGFSAEMEDAYLMLRPRLLSAVGNLAKRGYRFSVIEQIDIVHDFFVENWPKIEENYDPQKGELGGYVYTSFINFAKARLKRYARLGRITDYLEDTPHTATSNNYRYDPHSYDNQKLSEALDKTPTNTKDLLLFFFSASPSSFRSVAREYEISRYEAQKRVAKAFFHLLLRFERPPCISTEDWKVSRTLAAVGYNIEQAAHQLGMTNSQIRKADARTHKEIANLIRNQ